MTCSTKCINVGICRRQRTSENHGEKRRFWISRIALFIINMRPKGVRVGYISTGYLNSNGFEFLGTKKIGFQWLAYFIYRDGRY
uniref:Uncharacterized protein n=1 Tax=Romanomermis culicivorax TaxID=13658 RepID=A0A915IQP1_ROMCU